MRPCAKYLAFALAAAFVFARGAVAQTGETPKKDDPQRLITNFPIPPGEGGKVIRFPYEENKKKKMFFNVDEMQRKDIEHIQMINAKITTYDDNEKTDFILLLPVSVFDLRTQLLTTDKPFVLKRADFELIGDSLELDTFTHQATITGKVKMIIYNIQDPAKKETPHE